MTLLPLSRATLTPFPLNTYPKFLSPERTRPFLALVSPTLLGRSVLITSFGFSGEGPSQCHSNTQKPREGWEKLGGTGRGTDAASLLLRCTQPARAHSVFLAGLKDSASRAPEISFTRLLCLWLSHFFMLDLAFFQKRLKVGTVHLLDSNTDGLICSALLGRGRGRS